jgi:hypothetical protein
MMENDELPCAPRRRLIVISIPAHERWTLTRRMAEAVIFDYDGSRAACFDGATLRFS